LLYFPPEISIFLAYKCNKDGAPTNCTYTAATKIMKFPSIALTGAVS